MPLVKVLKALSGAGSPAQGPVVFDAFNQQNPTNSFDYTPPGYDAETERALVLMQFVRGAGITSPSVSWSGGADATPILDAVRYTEAGTFDIEFRAWYILEADIAANFDPGGVNNIVWGGGLVPAQSQMDVFALTGVNQASPVRGFTDDKWFSFDGGPPVTLQGGGAVSGDTVLVGHYSGDSNEDWGNITSPGYEQIRDSVGVFGAGYFNPGSAGAGTVDWDNYTNNLIRRICATLKVAMRAN